VRLKTALNIPSFLDGMFEHATVIGGDTNKMFFECNCGREFSLSLEYDVYNAEQIRCTTCKRKLAPDIGERYVYKRVKSDARKAGRVFHLPFDWFKHAIHAPCHYCGSTDKNEMNVLSRRPGEFLVQNFRYNGLDRLNNDIGYEIQNCVPCCFICNRAKQSMPYSEFIEWIDNMIQYRGNQIRG
jgi:hypothetical protein